MGQGSMREGGLWKGGPEGGRGTDTSEGAVCVRNWSRVKETEEDCWVEVSKGRGLGRGKGRGVAASHIERGGL